MWRESPAVAENTFPECSTAKSVHDLPKQSFFSSIFSGRIPVYSRIHLFAPDSRKTLLRITPELFAPDSRKTQLVRITPLDVRRHAGLRLAVLSSSQA